ncbi:MAG: helix-turn-helix domain-containing protein [Bacteroidetes bacterium]|nr:helix-turn-helix domain-containing protein [Bacteroidota bacterium]MBS1741007.1 helix-turn-helix domain-containing protein [Bacteroidota bacterium]
MKEISVMGNAPNSANLAEQFLSDIRTIKETLSKMLHKKDANAPIGVEEAARFIMKSVSTVYTLCSKNQIPHYKQGNTTYFFRNELQEWIKTGKVALLI